jgi:hypothetical protein
MERILFFNMAGVLAELNTHFVNHETMSKKEFMDIQKDVWETIKKHYNIVIKDDL